MPRFTAVVERLEVGFMHVHALRLPAEVAAGFKAAGARRVVGTLNGHRISRGVMNSRAFGPHLEIGRTLLRDIGAGVGDAVAVVIEPDPNPDAVEMPEELEIVLAQDEAAGARFHAMTPGRRRGLAYYVSSAKREETRITRALDLAKKLRTNTLYGDREE